MKHLPQVALMTLAVAGGVGLSPDTQARVTGFDITNTVVGYDGERFGASGAYERIEAVASFAIDPSSARASNIADIDKAPVNEQGEVLFSTQVVMLRPTEQASGVLFFPSALVTISPCFLNVARPNGGAFFKYCFLSSVS